MIFTRGLAALILTLFFSLTLHAEFLYKDDVVHNDRFAEEIEGIGRELREKTGVSLYLVMVRDLEQNQTTADFEKALAPGLKEPFVLMTFVELQKKVDIFARPQSLYKDFDKKQVLSPSATFAGALMTAVMFGRSWSDYKELLSDYGGTILPVLAEKTKGPDTVKKYSVAMFNGYEDVSSQIAESRGVTLSSNAGKGGTYFLDALRLLFYGIILYALIIYIRNKFRKRKPVNEQ